MNKYTAIQIPHHEPRLFFLKKYVSDLIEPLRIVYFFKIMVYINKTSYMKTQPYFYTV